MVSTIEQDLGGAVQRKNLTEQLYEILEGRILSGKILPGTKLSEENVAEAFRVSRSPAREAITELERIGLATRTGARDRAVAMPTEDFIRETYEVWWVLDAGRTYLACLEAGPEDHKRLYELLDEIDAAESASDEAARTKLTREFHELIYRGCKNVQLLRIIDDYSKYIRWFRELYFKPVDKSKASRIEHRHIVDRYVKKDLAGLTDLIRRHIMRQCSEIIGHFSEAKEQSLESAQLNPDD